MDKGTGKEQGKNELAEDWLFPKSIRFPLDVKRTKELLGILERIDQNYLERIAGIDKAAKSIFADKNYANVAKWFVAEETNRLKNEVSILFGIAAINERLATIETTLQSVGKKVNLEMPRLEKQVKELKSAIKEPLFAEMHSFIQMVKKQKEASEKAQEEYVE